MVVAGESRCPLLGRWKVVEIRYQGRGLEHPGQEVEFFSDGAMKLYTKLSSGGAMIEDATYTISGAGEFTTTSARSGRSLVHGFTMEEGRLKTFAEEVESVLERVVGGVAVS